MAASMRRLGLSAAEHGDAAAAAGASADGRERGTAFAAVAPDRDLLALKLRNSHATAPTARRECRARPTPPAAARSRARRHRAAAGSRGEARHQRILAPVRRCGQRRHRRARLLALADAFERLVVLEFQQRVEARRLRRLVEQVAPEDAHQARLGHERRQRQEHEMAFRADAAPALRRALAEDVEVAVAAGKMRVVAIRCCANCRATASSRERSQQRVVLQVRGDVRLHVRGRRPARMPSPSTTGGSLRRCRGSCCRSWPSARWRTPPGRRPCSSGGQHQDRRVHRGDRDMAVPGALAVHVEQLRRQLRG